MNTLLSFALLLCACLAYASALPANAEIPEVKELPAEGLKTEESRWGGWNQGGYGRGWGGGYGGGWGSGYGGGWGSGYGGRWGNGYGRGWGGYGGRGWGNNYYGWGR